MSIALTSVRFNHDADDPRHSALNLRLDAAGAIALPEWLQEPNAAVRNAPAAYSRQHAAGQALTLQVELRRSADMPDEVEVRAIDPQSRAAARRFLWSPSWSAGLSASARDTTPAPGGNLLGDIAPQRVRFRADGRTDATNLVLRDTRIASRGVGRHDVHWLWQYRGSASMAWTDFALSTHTLYLLLSTPTAPWTQQPNTAANTQLPWSVVLEHACRWAAGATTPTTAAAAITASVYELGRLGVISYGCPLWAMEMYARSFAPWNHFDCTAWLERLAGGLGNGPYVNCTDCATIVSTFANALGCDLWQSRMGRYSPQFATFPILAIGTLQWQIPCGVWPAFSFHEVAWTGRCSDDDLVFDACLLLDADLMPWFAPRQARLPVAARFGRPGEGGYRDQLATPLGRFDCVARSQERRRRLVF